MDFELRRAREKLEKEQKERKAQAKARLERERKAKGEARKQREAIEAVQRSRRLDALEAQEKTLILSFKDKGLGAGTYSVGVYGFEGTSKFVVSVIINDNIQRTVGQQAGSSSSPTKMDTVECRNCKRFIPSRTVALHEAYCSRRNVVCQHVGCGIVLRVEEAKNHVHCDKCGQAFQQVEMEKHMKVFHEPIQCPCGVILEKVQMVEHQASVCPLRLIACRFCGDMVHAGDTAVDLRDKMQGRLHPDHW